ncbi:MAG: hypothetical protein Q7I92_15365 [Humidesulfovibrio sp.]|nr:hypothetical protein [Humidesulfovibrio sp.]
MMPRLRMREFAAGLLSFAPSFLSDFYTVPVTPTPIISRSTDNSVAIGGDGGNAAQADGRGGRRTRSPAEGAGLPTELWKYGFGGAGGNLPEYNRRLQILIKVREEYMNMFPDEVVFIMAGIDQVPQLG